jgi:hypothetical protein
MREEKQIIVFNIRSFSCTDAALSEKTSRVRKWEMLMADEVKESIRGQW